MNSASLVGRLTRDPEVRVNPNSGKAIAKFTLAVRRNGNEADFIPCTAFGKTADIIGKYVFKGDQLGVVGEIRISNYEKDGQSRRWFEVTVSRISLIGGKSRQEERPPKTFTAQELAQNNPYISDDPFDLSEYEDYGDLNYDDVPF